MSLCIDLNADLGEGCPHDEPLLNLVTSASIACGATRATPTPAEPSPPRRNAVSPSAPHPGFADRADFGRREQVVTSESVKTLIQEQVETLLQWTTGVGVRLRFVKPHGALYNQAQKDEEVAQA